MKISDAFSIVDALPEPILLVSQDGTIEIANPGAAGVLGWQREALLSLNFFDLVDAPRDDARQYLESSLRTSDFIPGGFGVRTQNNELITLACRGRGIQLGSRRQVLLRWLPNSTTNAGFIQLNQNIEDLRREVKHRKHTESALRDSETRMRAIMETAVEGIITFLDDGTIESFNHSSQLMTGYDARAIIGSNITTWLSPEVDLSFVLKYLKAGAKPGADPIRLSGQEIPFRHKDGTLIPVEFSLAGLDLEGKHLYIGVLRDIRERQQLEEKLLHQASHDHLTGIPTRILLEDRVSQAIESARRKNEQLALLFIDLDRFKLVNDSLGHDIGDKLLCEFVNRLKQECRGSDTLCRIGGDEFVWLVTGIASEQDAILPATRVLECTREPFRFDDRELLISASVGVSLFPRDGEDVQTLLNNADAAMYTAKESGKNTFRAFSSEIGEKIRRHVELETRLRRAIQRDEFELHYQPQLSLVDGRICGMEALVRWQDPVFGLIGPNDFIPLAEESGLIIELGNWVLEKACQQAVRWRDQGFQNLRMAVNVSPRQFDQPDLVDSVTSVLEQTGLKAEHLELELTEGSIMTHVDQNTVKLSELKRLGVSISIDDFGTGYSSLAYLQQFPIDKLKIDRSFIENISRDRGDLTLVRTIIGLAHNLGLRVIAEGVETEAQLSLVRSEGCEEVQGYLVGRPCPAAEIEHMLVAHDCPTIRAYR